MTLLGSSFFAASSRASATLRDSAWRLSIHVDSGAASNAASTCSSVDRDGSRTSSRPTCSRIELRSLVVKLLPLRGRLKLGDLFRVLGA